MRNRGHRVVFMGSPMFSVPILSMLVENNFVVGVVTQPDRPKGRGKKLVSPPIKETAEAFGIPVIQPVRMWKDETAKAIINEWQPDVIVVAAFGQILKPDILNIPAFGCINVHTSLLPRWRGASPIESAILAGDTVTGTTIMLMDEGMDTGPILQQAQMVIQPDWRTSELEAALSEQGARLLAQVLPMYLEGKVEAVPQPEDGITYAPLIKKEDGMLDFDRPMNEILCKIRAYHPWPGTTIPFQGLSIKITRASGIEGDIALPTSHSVINNLPAIRCADEWILCEEVQPAGKNVMSGDEFLRGYQTRWLEDNR